MSFSYEKGRERARKRDRKIEGERVRDREREGERVRERESERERDRICTMPTNRYVVFGLYEHALFCTQQANDRGQGRRAFTCNAQLSGL